MIDWGRVEELCAEIGEPGFAEIVCLFWEEVEEVLAGLSNHPAAKLESDLHFLKGSAWNLGFTDFGAQCQDGERKAALGRAAEVDPVLLIGLFCATKAAFLAGLQAGGRNGRSA